MRGYLSVRFFGLACAGLVGFAGAAGAQQQAAAQAEIKGDQLEEVIVTATKRESTVETTPISITAITGQELQDRGITDLESVVQTVPGVSMRTSGGGQTELEMRGMTSSGGNSSTVGFYLDDTPLTAPSSAQNGKVVIDPNLYDLNRIEVLRGPQGTLYGSGSMGGTIKLVPNAPDPNEFDVTGELIFGGTDGGNSLNHTENAMVNLPFGDTAALRIVGSLEHLSRLDRPHRHCTGRVPRAHRSQYRERLGNPRQRAGCAGRGRFPRREQRESAQRPRRALVERFGSPLNRALVHVPGAHARRPQPHRQQSRDSRQLSAVRSR